MITITANLRGGVTRALIDSYCKLAIISFTSHLDFIFVFCLLIIYFPNSVITLWFKNIEVCVYYDKESLHQKGAHTNIMKAVITTAQSCNDKSKLMLPWKLPSV